MPGVPRSGVVFVSQIDSPSVFADSPSNAVFKRHVRFFAIPFSSTRSKHRSEARLLSRYGASRPSVPARARQSTGSAAGTSGRGEAVHVDGNLATRSADVLDLGIKHSCTRMQF
jgi:hypothetical protein